MALQFFLPEEMAEVIREVTSSLKRGGEAARARGRDAEGRFGGIPGGGARPGSPGFGRAGAAARGAVGAVRTAVQTSVTNALLGFLPEEARESIRLASLLGGIVPVAGTIAGAALGPLLVQARRKIKRDEARQSAFIQAVGIAGVGKNLVAEDFDLARTLNEAQGKFDDLKSSLLAGDVDRTLEIVRFLATKGKAGAAASRAYIDNLADGQGHTRAHTEAEAAFNRAQGAYVPRRLNELYSDLNNRAQAEFSIFYKDPPVKG